MLESDHQIEEDYELDSVQEENKLTKRMANFRQHLSQKLVDMGLELDLPSPKNKDPELAVQQHIEQLTSLLIQKTEQVIQDHLNLTELVNQNENLILKYYAGVLSLAQVMIVFSKDLYTGGQHISTFRNFKKLSDEFAEYSVLLNDYLPFTSQFEETSKKFLFKQQQLLHKIIFKDEQTQPQTSRENIQIQLQQLRQQNHELLQVLRKYEQQLNKYQPLQEGENGSTHKQNLRLMGQLDKLQRVLNQNNEDFAIEIQRYNRLLYDQREQYKRLEMQLRNDIRVLEYSIRQIEKQLNFSKEQKYKDQLMIQNLIRKNRNLQKRRDSYQITSPPSRGLNHTAVLPISPKRMQTQNSSFKKNI